MGGFGLTLANRAVVLGAIEAQDLLDFAQEVDASGAFNSVWVGDSLLAKPRLESVTLLSALAAVTKKVRLGVGCMATFVHRHPALFAQQWASLDVISRGRTWLVVCLGGPDEMSPAQALEHAVMGIKSKERVARLEEGIPLLRKLFHEKKVSHQGRFYQIEGVTIEPSPVQNPCPIWIASNPTGLTWKDGASAPDPTVERAFRRVARYADGWMTNKVDPNQFQRQWNRIKEMAREEGRDPERLGNALTTIFTSKSTGRQPWRIARRFWTNTTRPISARDSWKAGRWPGVPSRALSSSSATLMPGLRPSRLE